MLTEKEWLEVRLCSDPNHKMRGAKRKDCLDCVYLHGEIKVKEALDKAKDDLMDWGTSHEKAWGEQEEEDWREWEQDIEPNLSEQALALGRREENHKLRFHFDEIFRNLDATITLIHELQEDMTTPEVTGTVCSECGCFDKLHYNDEVGQGCFGAADNVEVCFCPGFVPLYAESTKTSC